MVDTHVSDAVPPGAFLMDQTTPLPLIDKRPRHLRRLLVGLVVALAVLVPAIPASAAPEARVLGAPAASTHPVVAIVATPSGTGYWLVGADGGVFSSGDAAFFGSTGALNLNQPIVGMAVTPSGGGYWLVGRDGGIFAFGDAGFYGSTGALRLNQPIVAMAATTTGKGYWLAAADGGIFAFGDATFSGSTGATKLNQPIVGLAVAPGSAGYWLVARDGGIFAFGRVAFYGSTGAMKLNQPIVGMASTTNGDGYWLAAADGGLFAFGTAPFHGSGGGSCLGAPVIGIAASRGALGYWMATSGGLVLAFSPSGAQVPEPCPPRVDPDRAASLDLFNRLNDERAARGLRPLVWDEHLSNSAYAWSAEMAMSGFRHSDLNLLLAGLSNVGENIAWGRGSGFTTSNIHVSWMRSDGHRQNILSPAYDVVGIGVFTSLDGTMWATEQFGRTVGATTPTSFGPIPPADPIVRTDPGIAG